MGYSSPLIEWQLEGRIHKFILNFNRLFILLSIFILKMTSFRIISVPSCRTDSQSPFMKGGKKEILPFSKGESEPALARLGRHYIAT